MKKGFKGDLFVFIIWPLWSLVHSIRSFDKRTARIFILLFFCLFGFSYVVPNEKADVFRIIQNFKDAVDRPFSDIFTIISGLYIDPNIKPDFILNLITYIVSRVTSNGSVLMMALAFTAGLLLLKNIRSQYDEYCLFKNRNSLTFLAFLVVLLPISYIGQFRYYSATLMFLVGAYKIIIEGWSWKYFILASFSVFFHFSFIIPVVILIFYLIAGNQNKIYLPLLISSFFLADLVFPYLLQFSKSVYLGNLDKEITAYTSKSYFEQVEMQRATTTIWILNNFRFLNKYFFLFILLYFKYRKIYMDKALESLFSFAMLFLAISNYFIGIKDLYERFLGLFSVIAVFFLIRLFVRNQMKNMHKLTYIGIVLLAINFIIVFRYSIEYTNFSLILPFFISPLLLSGTPAILNLLK